MDPKRPTVGVALIVKDAEQTLANCLESLRFADQVVICLDSRSSDRSAEIAQEHGAEVHSFEWTDDFAAARNTSFSFLKPELDWWLWVDADDVVRGSDKLLEALAELADKPHIIGLWLKYEYAHSEQGLPMTVFTRERVLRPSVGWKWRHRVHEVLVPDNPGPWVKFDDCVIVHQPHDFSPSAPRNLQLLLKMYYEDDPQSYDLIRCLRELGDQCFATRQLEQALPWYMKCLQENKNDDYLDWWCWYKIAQCYRFLGDVKAAEDSAMTAFKLWPQWSESAMELAYVYAAMRDWDKTIRFADMVPTGQELPHQLFANPLNRTINWRLVKAEALANRAEVELGLELLQPVADLDKSIRDKVTAFEQAVDRKQRSLAYIEAEDGSEPPGDIRSIGAVRDVWVPRLMRSAGEPDVVMFCGYAPEEWSPANLGGGIGGSETAVIQVAQRLTARGYKVHVYNNPGAAEGTHEGVAYIDAKRFDPDVRGGNVFVSWRGPAAVKHAEGFDIRLLWMHDLNVREQLNDWAHHYDFVLGVSEWHRDYLRMCYPSVLPELFGWVPNGIDLTRFDGEEPRSVHRCVWSSSPDRGLDVLLAVWPEIKRRVDDAELHVFYGWEGVDRAIASGRRDLADFKQFVERLADQPGVVWRGRVGQDELAREQMKADAWLYPTHFVETSCITAMEMQAAQTVPVVASIGALPLTVGNAGLAVPGNPHNSEWRRKFIGIALSSLLDIKLRRGLQSVCALRAPEFSWDKSVDRWLQLIEQVRHERTNAA